jgi:glutamate dehydrogenase (NAD(P)+)
LAAIEEKLRRNTRQVLDEVEKRHILPREAALGMALQRVKRAVSFQRWAAG